MTIKEISKELETVLADYEAGKIGEQGLYDNMVDTNMELSAHIEQASKPMRLNIIINDETIMQDVLHELDEMEFAEEAEFPTDEAMQELAEEITDTIITRCENDADYLPTWTAVWEAVHDAVREHEYDM